MAVPSTVLPPVSKKFVASMGGLWLGLTSAAAVLASADNVVADVFAGVIASGASIALATTGIAGYVSRRQHRQHLTETAESTALFLNTAADDTGALISALFTTVHGVVPLLEVSSPRGLTQLGEPPYDRDSAEVVRRVVDGLMMWTDERGSEGWDRNVAVTREGLAMWGPAPEDPDRRRDQELSEMEGVLSTLCAVRDSEQAVEVLGRNVRKHWPRVTELTSRISSSLATLSPEMFSKLRPVLIQLARLQAKTAATGLDGPVPRELEYEVSEDRRMAHLSDESSQTLRSIGELLGETLELSRVLTDLRSEFRGIETDSDRMQWAQQLVGLRDVPTREVRSITRDLLVLSVMAAWKDIEASMPAESSTEQVAEKYEQAQSTPGRLDSRGSAT